MLRIAMLAALAALAGLALLTALAPPRFAPRLPYDPAVFSGGSGLSFGFAAAQSSTGALLAADLPLPLPYDLDALPADDTLSAP